MNKIKFPAPFNNPVFWFGVIALINLVLKAAGIEIEDITSWTLAWQAFLSIVKNPAILLSVIVAVLNYWNNNHTPGIGK